MRTLLWFLGLFCATAFAQDGPGPKVIHVPRSTPSGPALVQTEPQGSYCESGRDAVGHLAIRGQSIPRDLRLLYQNCAPGDTISFSANITDFAAQVCDFSKSMMVVPSAPGSQIVCVLSPQRGVRNRR